MWIYMKLHATKMELQRATVVTAGHGEPLSFSHLPGDRCPYSKTNWQNLHKVKQRSNLRIALSLVIRVK